MSWAVIFKNQFLWKSLVFKDFRFKEKNTQANTKVSTEQAINLCQIKL